MDRYAIALKKEPPKKPDALERAAQELMKMPLSDLPPIALGYIKHQNRKYGARGEVTLTALAHYAQAVEKLYTSNNDYKIDKNGLKWFKNPVPASFKECVYCKKTTLMVRNQVKCENCEVPF